MGGGLRAPADQLLPPHFPPAGAGGGRDRRDLCLTLGGCRFHDLQRNVQMAHFPACDPPGAGSTSRLITEATTPELPSVMSALSWETIRKRVPFCEALGPRSQVLPQVQVAFLAGGAEALLLAVPSQHRGGRAMPQTLRGRKLRGWLGQGPLQDRKLTGQQPPLSQEWEHPGRTPGTCQDRSVRPALPKHTPHRSPPQQPQQVKGIARL